MSLTVKKGDTVIVISGKDRGKTAKVRKVLPSKNKVILERINLIKRHTKPTRTNPQGGIVEQEAPLDRSNVMVYCHKCARGVKVGKKYLEDGSKVRFCKRCGEILDKS